MEFKSSDIALSSFEEMGLAENIVSFIHHRGIKKPTEIQSRVIPLALGGENIVGIAQTGSGKTMAFVLPVLTGLLKRPTSRAIVFAPSREMAQQIHKVFSDLALLTEIEAALIIAGTPNDKQVSALRKLPRLIVATPGRMLDHLQTNKLLLKGTEFIVIDEADRMLDMGFAPQLEKIRATMRGQWQTMMFSASFNNSIEKLLNVFFQAPPFLIRGAQAEAPVEKLKQTVLFMRKNQKNDQLLIELGKTKKSVIIFVADRERCEEIGTFLQYNGVKSDFVHGEMVQGHRNRVVREFREGANRVLVSTDLLARGLDIPEIGTVINVDLPYEPEDFLHRIGRTARAGRHGRAITFVSQLDAERFKKIEGYLTGAEIIKLEPNFAFKNN